MNSKRNSTNLMPESAETRFSTGIKGADEILKGGFLQGSTNLLRGGPGVGKTTMGLHFLSEGAKAGESVLFITLGESVMGIRNNAERLHIDVSSINFLDLSPDPNYFSEVESYDIFTPAEVEREPTTQKIIGAIKQLRPNRVFVDAMTQFKFLSNDNFQYRKQALSFLHFLQENKVTVLFSSESSKLAPDDDLQFMADSVITLEYNNGERLISVEKFRGSDFIKGKHAYNITHNGIVVFPKIKPQSQSSEPEHLQLSFGIPRLDLLTGGGIETGTITLISGPSGVGKTTLSMQLAHNLAKHRFNTAFYTFEEEPSILTTRCQQLGIDTETDLLSGRLSITKIEPLEFGADEFAHIIINNAKEKSVALVIIDSTSGFKLALHGQDVVASLHALCKHLQQLGITVLLINEVENITGNFQISEERISYLADNIIFLRYLEIEGKLRKSIGVLKKRLSNFEKNMREFDITEKGIEIGTPLENLRGILLGIPNWIKNKHEAN